MKVLMVSKTHTHPVNSGYSKGVLAMCTALQNLGCTVDFLYVQELPMHKSAQAPYQEAAEITSKYWGDRFYQYRVPIIEKVRMNLMLRYRHYFCQWRQGIDDAYPRGLTAYVSRLHAREHYDICIVNCYFLSKLLTKVHFDKGCVFTEDCFAYKNLVVGEKCLHITAHQEAQAMQRADCLFAVQDEECCYFRLISPLSKVYNIYSRYEYHPQQVVGNKNILFLSSENPFNVNGLRWFANEVFPIVLEHHPSAKLLVGGNIYRKVPELAGRPGIEFQGYVETPDAFYAQGDVVINPVYQGTGLKVKTFEAISYGKVTLVHPHSTRGIFRKESAPLYASGNPVEWVGFLDKVWSDTSQVAEIKEADKRYMDEMDNFIMHEYKRFLEDRL